MKLLIQWAVTSSALILIVLAARYVLRNKLSARWRYALWGIVLLRLLVPFQVELPASAPLPVLASNFAPEVADVELYALRTASRPLSEDNLAEMLERGVAPGTVIGTEAPIHQIGDVEIEGYAHCFVLSDTGIDTYFFYTTLPKFLMTLWVIGAVWVALTIFRSNRYFFGRLKYYRHELEGVETPIPVYTAANLPSPCLFGVLRPAVYLTPAAAENPDILRHVLAHELTHYAHKDHIWSLLRCLALALHWYNPLVWLAVVLSKGDGELACDEGAVARLGEAERIPYGRTLVDMVAARSLRPGDLLSCSTAMTGGKKSIQERVARLIKKPETVKAALFAVVAVVVLSAVFVFAGRGDNQILEAYRDTVTQANSVAFVSSPLSSVSSPTIIDDDSISQAKEILLDISPLKSGEKPDLTGLDSAPSVFLFGTYDNGTLMQQQYTLLSQDGHTYVLAWSSQQDGSTGYETLGYLPDNVCARLDELSRQYGQYMDTQIRSPELIAFLREVESASSIRYSPPTYSSTIYPYPITDKDLLSQAKEALRSAVPLGPDGPEPDRGTLMHASTVSLALEDGSNVYYTLLRQDSYTYVLEGAVRSWYEDTQQDPWYSTAFRSEEDIISILESLARQQSRPEPVQPDLDPYRNTLTQEEIDRANEAFRTDMQLPDGGWAPSEISCFFTSSYDSPARIDLEKFLQYCPLAEEVNPQTEREEYQTVIAAGWWVEQAHNPDFLLPTPMWRYPREKVSALLERYTGVALDQLDWGDMFYLEEYDSFYNFTSDYGPGFFTCAGGQAEGDTVILWSAPNGDGDRSELALQKSGGSWLIQSFHTAYPR